MIFNHVVLLHHVLYQHSYKQKNCLISIVFSDVLVFSIIISLVLEGKLMCWGTEKLLPQ